MYSRHILVAMVTGILALLGGIYAREAQHFILVNSLRATNKIDLTWNNMSSTVLVEHEERSLPCGIDYDPVDQRFVFSILLARKSDAYIGSFAVNGSSRQVLFQGGLSEPQSVAVDWKHRKVYWSDYSSRSIEVGGLNDSKRRTLLLTRTRPGDVKLDVERGLLFWAHQSGIDRYDLHGNNKTIVIDKQSPWGLALDTSRAKLYWSDYANGNVEECDYDGKNRRIILHTKIRPKYMAWSQGALYFTAYQVVYTLDMNTGMLKLVARGLPHLKGLYVYYRPPKVICPPGQYKTNTSCTPCPINQFQTKEDQSSCLPCPEGTSTQGEQGATECIPDRVTTTKEPPTTEVPTQCSPGYYLSIHKNCIMCPPDTYQGRVGQRNCTQCPQGTSTEGHVGAESVSACVKEAQALRSQGNAMAAKPKWIFVMIAIAWCLLSKLTVSFRRM